jgi:hypothetical protein
MLELGSSGSARGVLGNEHPYREPRRIAGTRARRPAVPPEAGFPARPGSHPTAATLPACAAVSSEERNRRLPLFALLLS